jgi:D-glycero-D-manno-heptose 1,7-bisphosphate phosphatase
MFRLDEFSRGRVAIFLDRDGTIVVDRSYPRLPEDMVLLDGAREAFENFKKIGCILFLFSNQSGVARRLLTMDDVEACNRRMLKLLGTDGDIFAEICMAPEFPSDNPIYRKPSPKFIVEMMEKHGLATENCYMVGDKKSDVLAGTNAGVSSILIAKNDEIGTEILGDCRGESVKIFPSILYFSRWLSHGHRPDQGESSFLPGPR